MDSSSTERTTTSISSAASLVTSRGDQEDCQPELKRKKTTSGPFKHDKLESNDGLDKTEPLDEGVTFENDRDDEVGIPTLVVEILLEKMKDVDVLKTCRLVNKYWNGLACPSLQKNSVTKLKEGAAHDEAECESRFDDFLLSQVFRSTPSPFTNFHISTSGFSQFRFYNFVLREQFVTTKLTISEHSRVGYSRSYASPILTFQRLNEFLKAKQSKLTSLKFETDDLYHDYMQTIFNDIKFPRLESLIIDGTIRYCNCTRFELLLKTLEDSSLQNLTLKNVTRCLIPILKLNLSRLVKLELDAVYSRFPEEFWDVVANLNLPSLQSLVVHEHKSNEHHVGKLNTFLRSVSSTLLKLKCNDLGKHTNVMFPKLLDLSTSCPPDVSNVFVDERFPSLQSITIGIHRHKAEHITFVTDVLYSMKGVRSLNISFPYFDSQFTAVIPVELMNFARKFPNVDKFGISTGMSSPYLLRIHRAFPNLKALSIDGPIDFATLSGTPNHNDETWLRPESKPIQVDPRKTPIFYFKELKSLTLNTTINKDALRLCLSLLSKLKYLEFSWSDANGAIPIQLFEDSRVHFKKIRIDWVSQDILKQLQNALPDCEITRGLEKRTVRRTHFICTVD